jgi:hypothetical protein
MKFHEFRSWWDSHKTKLARLGRSFSYSKQVEALKEKANRIQHLPRRRHELLFAHIIENESKWYDDRRPFYKVYPCIADSLCKLKLDFNCDCPSVPRGTISIRFAETQEPKTNDGYSISALLVHDRYVEDAETGEPKKMLFVQVKVKERPNVDDYYFFRLDTNHPHMNIEQFLESRTTSPDYHEVKILATRIALAVCMLANDPEIITLDVLSEQQSRYDGEKDENWKRRAEQKAKSKGVFGWSIGKNIKVTPHFRRPHFALRHTGPNGSIPKIVAVKSCMVKVNKLTRVPTGYVLPDGTEVEDGKIAQNC